MDAQITRIVPVMLPNGTIMHVEAEPIGPVIMSSSAPTESDVADRRLHSPDEEALPFSEATREVEVADRTPISQQDIKSVMGAIEGIAQAVTTSAERSNAYEMTVEFGLKLAIENGQLTSLFVKGSGEANLKVSLKWARSTKEIAKAPGSGD